MNPSQALSQLSPDPALANPWFTLLQTVVCICLEASGQLPQHTIFLHQSSQRWVHLATAMDSLHTGMSVTPSHYVSTCRWLPPYTNSKSRRKVTHCKCYALCTPCVTGQDKYGSKSQWKCIPGMDAHAQAHTCTCLKFLFLSAICIIFLNILFTS